MGRIEIFQIFDCQKNFHWQSWDSFYWISTFVRKKKHIHEILYGGGCWHFLVQVDGLFFWTTKKWCSKLRDKTEWKRREKDFRLSFNLYNTIIIEPGALVSKEWKMEIESEKKFRARNLNEFYHSQLILFFLPSTNRFFFYKFFGIISFSINNN